jgi:hypothetical protein
MQSIKPIIIVDQLKTIIFVDFFYIELNLIFKPSMRVLNLKKCAKIKIEWFFSKITPQLKNLPDFLKNFKTKTKGYF